MSLVHQAIHAFKWSVLGEIASRGAGPLVFLVLARLLVPEDFGVVAAATVVISFSQVFADAGLAKALIQRQDKVEESANIVFWLNLGIGLAIATLILVGAPFIAGFFHDERIAPVVQVLSLQILLAAFSSVHTALLQKDLNFKALFWVRLATTAAPGLASIPLAIHGMGYWALVAGSMVGQMAQSAMLWKLNSWRPQWGMDISLTWELVGFGKWVMLSGLLGWLYGWMDAIMVGRYLGSHDMGLYRTGNTFVTIIFGLIFAPLLPVLYSLFSDTRYNQEKLGSALGTVARAIALIALPIGFCLYATAGLIAEVVFGVRWRGIDQVIGFLALMHAFSWIVGANGEAYRAIGKPHVETWANAIMLVIYLAGYLGSVQFGLQLFLRARLCLALLAVFVHIGIARSVLGAPVSNWFYARILVTSIASAVLVSQMGLGSGMSFFDLILMLCVFFSVSFIGIAFFEQAFVLKLIRMASSRG
jgi:PST family polysaccharide transporter